MSWFDNFMVWSVDPGADARNAEFQQKATATVQRQYAEGKIPDTERLKLLGQINDTGNDKILADPRKYNLETPSDAFEKSFVSGDNPVSRFINDLLKGLTNGIFRAIPWQVWVIAIAVLIFYLWPIIRPLLIKVSTAK